MAFYCENIEWPFKNWMVQGGRATRSKLQELDLGLKRVRVQDIGAIFSSHPSGQTPSA